MANTTSSATSDSPSAADTLAAKANVAYQSASQTLREQTDAVVRRIQPQIDAVTSYARNDPTKAILMSAAAGAALMGIVALLMRSGGSSRPDLSSLRDLRSARDVGSTAGSLAASTLATIRDAAMDLAERARSVAHNAIDSTHQKATDALGSSEKRASQTADSVSDTVADAWNSLRDQAAPVVDRLKPQLEAAANYARDEPARAALGIAAAGAVLIGLMALIRGSDSDSF